MSSPAPDAPLDVFTLGPHTVPRIWTGLWQLSGNGWGSAPVSKIRKGMDRYADDGYTAFADHYGTAEIIFGQFRQARPDPSRIVGATKWCVFRDVDPTRAVVEAAVRERLDRMGTTSVDLLQFHWQNYADTRYLQALEHLRDLRAEGLIRAIGLCNFDAARTDEICKHLGPGVIVSNQVQFSLIDTRPLDAMAAVCAAHGVKLLTYGTLCGGFLADAWLGQPEPELYSGALTPSQRKYLDMVTKAWGSWARFQELLAALRRVGDRHGARSVANVAVRWALEHEFVGAVIVGARLGLSEHPDDNRRVAGFALTDEDRAEIDAVLAQSQGRQLISTIGDCGAEYR